MGTIKMRAWLALAATMLFFSPVLVEQNIVAKEAKAAQPSFDCSKAKSWSERELCHDETLASLDVRLASLYRDKRVQLDSIQEKGLIGDQKQWLTYRENCKSALSPLQCLIDIYNKRILQLSNATYTRPEPLNESQAPQTPKPAQEAAENGEDRFQKGKTVSDNNDHATALQQVQVQAAAEQGKEKALIPPIHDCDRLAASPFDRNAVAPAVSSTKIDAAKAKAACEAALKEFPTAPRFQAQLGRSLYEAKQMQEAFAWFQKAAEQRYEYGMATLGELYASGEGVPQNFPEAAKWARKSGEHGSPLGQVRLASLYTQGQGVPKDQREATIWFQKAIPWLQKTAEQGFAEAQDWLGWQYASGIGVSQDFAKAADWYRRAAEQGDAYAQMQLGFRYANGLGVPKDYTEAVTWSRKAAVKGQVAAYTLLGWAYETGSGVRKDLQQARNWYRQAAEKGSAEAGQSLKNVDLAIAKEQELLESERKFPGIDFDHLDCHPGYMCYLDMNVPASFDVTDEAIAKDLLYRVYRVCNCGNIRICIRADQQLTQERCAVQGGFQVGVNGLTLYSNSEAKERARATADAEARENFRAFEKSSGIEKMVSVADLFANPFVYDGQTVGVVVDFHQMVAKGKGIFADRSESKAVIVSGLPMERFVHEEQNLLVVGRVKGTDMVRDTPLPHLAYVDVRKCATADCGDEFRWHEQIRK